MRKALTIGMTAAALTAAMPFHARGDADREQMSDASATFAPYYQRGPRIIHVPQPDERQDDAHGNEVRSNSRPAARASIDRRPAPAQPRKPRWAPRVDAPPPPGPRRAVLSAPPPRAETPNWIRPTPRFEEKFGAGEKFAAPDQPATTSVIPPPHATPPADAGDPAKAEP